MAVDQKAIELEMTYTAWYGSCQNPAVKGDDIRQCRRRKKHDPPCASGFGKEFATWDHEGLED